MGLGKLVRVVAGVSLALGISSCSQSELEHVSKVESPKVEARILDVNPLELEVAGPAPLWGSVGEYSAFVRDTVRGNSEMFIDTMYSSLGVSHEVPEIRFEYGEGEDSGSCEDAGYFEGEGVVVINDGCEESAFAKYKRNLRIRGIGKEGVVKHLDYTVLHEGAHDYFLNTVKSMGFSPWLEAKNGNSLNLLARHVVSEGVARYMPHYEGHGIIDKEDIESFDDKIFSVSPGEYGKNYPYHVGEHLVTAVLDENFEEGVKAFIKNPPTAGDLKDWAGYRDEIFDIIRGN